MMKPPPRGSILLLVLVFGSVFFIILGALVQLVIIENRAQDALIGSAQSFSIAEAGLEYYAWFLAHFPDDLTNGTGNPGPHTISYTDPSTGATLGTYTLSFEGASACGDTQLVDITSTGTSAAYPNSLTTLVARFASPTVARYARIVDDGTYPNIDFAVLTPDYAELKAIAQSNGIFLPRHEIPQDPHLGYRLIFNADGTVTVTLVNSITTLNTVQKVSTNKFSNDYTLIRTEIPYQTFSLPASCGLIYSEDNVWIEGVIPSKITLVASNLAGAGSAPDIIIHNNLTYSATDGSVGFTALAQHDVLIAPNSPTNLTIHGIYVAAEGAFGRNNYAGAAPQCLYENKQNLTLYGTIVSKLSPKTEWPTPCPNGSHAGYQTFTHSLDPHNATNPPPYTPSTSAERTFISWQQIR